MTKHSNFSVHNSKYVLEWPAAESDDILGSIRVIHGFGTLVRANNILGVVIETRWT